MKGRLHEELSSTIRLSLVASLDDVDSAEFKALRDVLECSDSVLSKNMVVLEKSGFISIKKGYVGNRPRTWLSLTKIGRKAYEEHRKALLAILRKQNTDA